MGEGDWGWSFVEQEGENGKWGGGGLGSELGSLCLEDVWLDLVSPQRAGNLGMVQEISPKERRGEQEGRGQGTGLIRCFQRIPPGPAPSQDHRARDTQSGTP